MNWSSIPLSECGELLTGGTPSRSETRFWGGGVPWISAKSLKEFEVFESDDTLTDAGVTVGTLVPAGSVLFVVRGMSLAKEFRVGITRRAVTFNQDLRALVPHKGVDGRYLARFLQAAEGRILCLVDEASHGTKRLTSERFERIEVPLPALPEQRRLADILDKANALRAKRRTALALLDTLNQSIFLEMFGDPIANPRGWSSGPLGEHAEKIGSGSTPTGGEAAYKSEGIALIRSMNVRDGSFLSDGLAFIDEGQAARLEGVVVKDGDVLLNITGASVARVCRAPGPILPARVNQHVAIIRPKPALMPGFLEQLLLSASMKQLLLKTAGAGATREAITKNQIERLSVMCPPISLQREFIRRLVAVEITRAKQETSLARSEELFTSLQHRAFRGEL